MLCCFCAGELVHVPCPTASTVLCSFASLKHCELPLPRRSRRYILLTHQLHVAYLANLEPTLLHSVLPVGSFSVSLVAALLCCELGWRSVHCHTFAVAHPRRSICSMCRHVARLSLQQGTVLACPCCFLVTKDLHLMSGLAKI